MQQSKGSIMDYGKRKENRGMRSSDAVRMECLGWRLEASAARLEVRGWRSEGREQRSDFRGQTVRMLEVGGEKAEDRSQISEGGGRKSVGCLRTYLPVYPIFLPALFLIPDIIYPAWHESI